MGSALSLKRLPQTNQLDMLTYLAAMADDMAILASRAKQDVAEYYFQLAATQLHQGVQQETARTRRPDEIKPTG